MASAASEVTESMALATEVGSALASLVSESIDEVASPRTEVSEEMAEEAAPPASLVRELSSEVTEPTKEVRELISEETEEAMLVGWLVRDDRTELADDEAEVADAMELATSLIDGCGCG